MKRFHTQLNLMLDRHLISKSDLARRVDIAPSFVSRMAQGAADCSADLMGRIAHCFPSDDALRLLAAWVEDKAEEAGYSPAQLRASLGSADGLHVPPGLRDDLQIILSSGSNSRELKGIIRNLADLLRPPQEIPETMVADAPGPPVPPPKPVTYGKRKK